MTVLGRAIRLLLLSLSLCAACQDTVLVHLTHHQPPGAHRLQLLVAERPPSGVGPWDSYSQPNSKIELRLSDDITGSLHIGAIVWDADERPFFGAQEPLFFPWPQGLDIELKALEDSRCHPSSIPFLTAIKPIGTIAGPDSGSQPLWTCGGGAGASIWDEQKVRVGLSGFGFRPDMLLRIGAETSAIPFLSLTSAEVEVICPASRPSRIELTLAGTQAEVRCPAREFSFVTKSLPVLRNAPLPIAAGDIDGDGHQDLVTASLQSSVLTVLRNDGQAGFVATACVASLPPTALLLRGPELIVATQGGIEVLSYEQGTCQRSQPPLPVPSAYLGAMASLGPGVVALDQRAGQLLRFSVDGGGHLSVAAPPIALPTSWRPLALTELPSGAGAQLAIIPENQPQFALFQDAAVKVFDLDGCTPQALAAHPQGKSIYVACRVKTEIQIREVTVDGKIINSFSPLFAQRSSSNQVTSLVAADLDGDDRPELALAWSDERLRSAYVTVQRTIPISTSHASIRTGHGSSMLVSADFNGDGQLDLALSQEDYDNVILLTNVSR